MEITPNRTGISPVSSVKPTSGTASRSKSALDGATQESIDRDANLRLNRTQREVEEMQHQADSQLEAVRESYIREEAKQADRGETALEAQRNKGYEALRDLQRQQQAELNKIRREGEKDLSSSKNWYDNQIKSTESTGNQKLDSAQKNSTSKVAYEDANAEITLKDVKSRNESRMSRARELADDRFARLDEETRAQYEKSKVASAEAAQNSTQHFEENFHNLVQQQGEVVDNLSNRASQQIREIRQDTSQKLAAYATRQKDPFYKLVEFDVMIRDAGDHYEMTAKIPEHEQKNISVSLKGNQLVLSGHRRNEEKLDISEGHRKSTASFQSFHESFPLPLPVDGKELYRAFKGEQLTVTVPKKPLVYEAKVANPPPGRSKVERPQFPDNLPHVHQDEESSDHPASKSEDKTSNREVSHDATVGAAKAPGSRTLG